MFHCASLTARWVCPRCPAGSRFFVLRPSSPFTRTAPPQSLLRCQKRGALSLAVSQQLAAIEKRHADIHAALLVPEIETKEYIRLSRELSTLGQSVQAIGDYRRRDEEAASLRTVIAEAAREKTDESAELASLAQVSS